MTIIIFILYKKMKRNEDITNKLFINPKISYMTFKKQKEIKTKRRHAKQTCDKYV